MENKDTYLYVLLLPHMDEEYKLGYVIKFGYTEDFDQRMKIGYSAYYDFVSVLHVYKGEFSKDDEFAIKQHLKNYCLFKNEWFKCCQEVLGFFKTYDTTEKLKQKISEIPVIKRYDPKYHRVNYILLDYLIQMYYNDLKDILEIQDKKTELETILRGYTEKNQYNYLKEKLGFNLDDFNNYQESRLSSNSDDFVKKSVDEFNGIKAVRDRLKFMIEYSKTASKENLGNFLELIPGKYKDYYDIVGPDIITACSYVESEIKKKWRETLSNGEIKDEVTDKIYRTFIVGQRYTKSDIKDVLNNLYEKLGYKKKAKATDLELYYIMKYVKFQDSEGKWTNGFELIGRK